jgi:uracil-DNA glycosylase family 4
MDTYVNSNAMLDALATEISACRLCDAYGIDVTHMPSTKHGVYPYILVIGVQPGKNAAKALRPFSGPAGRRLFQWLVSANIGATQDEILNRCYFTTLSKCYSSGNRRVASAIRNCFAFLSREMAILKPHLCLTLGPEPLATLFKYNGPIENVVGRAWTERTLGIELFGIFPADCRIVPLPSPASRWLQNDTNQRLVGDAIAILRASAALSMAIPFPTTANPFPS